MAAAASILERDAERDILERLVGQAARSEGALALVEGPAGIGKTALLHDARQTARARDFRVLAATGSELDRDFPFGLVHQLLDGVMVAADEQRRDRLLDGAASLAEMVLAPATPAAGAGDPSHAALHGLYWLCANLADEGPVALVLDDLHWADRPSLRFLEFLARRLEGLPVLVLGAVRSGEPGAGDDLLAALAAYAAHVVRPSPLGAEAAARMIAGALGGEPDDEFTAACLQATGGNPLLLRELARTVSERGLRGHAGEATAIAGIDSAGVARAVRRRLVALGADAEAVASVAALLGERVRIDDLAALTGRSEPDAAQALDRLAAAEVLEADSRAFVHPLVRQAVAAGVPPGERARLHAAAARRLGERGARLDEISTHLLAAEPTGDPWVAATLRRAARAAFASGAAEAAIAYLRRALAEPPPAQERAVLALELGELEAAAGAAEADEHLAMALDGGLEGDEAARARAARARLLLLSDPPGAMAALELARRDARDPGLAVRLEAMLLDATFYDATLAGHRDALLAADGDTDSPALRAHRAVEAAYHGAPAGEVARLAREATAGGALVRALGPAATYHLVVLALRHAEQRELAATLLDEGVAESRRLGSRLALYFIDHARAYWELDYGSVVTAEAHARASLDFARAARLPMAEVPLVAATTEVLLERGALDEAVELVSGVVLEPAGEVSVAAPDFLSARAAVHRLQRRGDDALSDLRRARELLERRGWRVPLKGRVSLRLAELLAERGEVAEASELVAGEERAAFARGVPGTLGLVLRARARLPEEDAVGLLTEAAQQLAIARMGLNRAWALHDLGAVHRRAGRRNAAREPLREALDLASRAGADRLVGLLHEELLAAGARPQREALSGLEALTPSERRVVDLAAKGLTNREIAETLWITVKTVEVHLGHSYAKLDIRSRKQLPAALAG